MFPEALSVISGDDDQGRSRQGAQSIEQGRKRFDFGRSTPGDGTFLFKEQWGAVSEQLYWEYKLLGDSIMPSDDRQSAHYQRRIEAWKRLPLAVTSALGPRIARCVP